ncbi:hypothetical protein [Streptomyces sp. NPDC017230]|uniref:hypothetical protein n=1 Tax=unclassified Streptomyces TaxID=2593676 RepID=UPI00379305CF
MTSLLAEISDSQFASSQIIAALVREHSPAKLPTSALAQVLFLDEAELFDLYGDSMTAADVATYARNCPATHILTFICAEESDHA